MSQLNRFESIADLDNLPLQNGLRILEINTDGSFYKKDPYAGLGIYIPEQGSQQAIYFSSRLTGHKHNADRAEIQAAVTAVKITFLLHSSYDALIIRTDSQNLIRFVKDWEAMWSRDKDWSQIRVNIEKRFNNRFSECYYHAGEWLKYDSDFEELFTELITLKNSDKTFRVHWQYVRSHSGDHGNDTSDRLAKHGRKLLYDNKQLFESLKLFLLQKKNNNQCLSKKRYFPFNCPHLVEVTQVPVHISTISVVKVMNVNQQNVVKEKVDEYSQATKVITFRITKEAFNTCMKQRKLKIDQHIEVPVNPCVPQCSHCLQLNHVKSKCPKHKPRCSNCAQHGHERKDCTRKVGPLCGNCADRKLDDKHPVFSNQCLLREKAQNELAKKCSV